jgi:hypothetical protein
LSEINRRSAQLSATSSRLAGMAAQLDRLREVNETIRIFSKGSSRWLFVGGRNLQRNGASS